MRDELNIEILIFGLVAGNFMMLLGNPDQAAKVVAITFLVWIILLFIPLIEMAWNKAFKIKKVS